MHTLFADAITYGVLVRIDTTMLLLTLVFHLTCHATPYQAVATDFASRCGLSTLCQFVSADFFAHDFGSDKVWLAGVCVLVSLCLFLSLVSRGG